MNWFTATLCKKTISPDFEAQYVHYYKKNKTNVLSNYK